jgi:hypothetical protein
VARIDEAEADAGERGLVGHERPELAKGPIAVFGTYRLPNRCALADMRQVFQRKCPCAAFGFLYQLLGNPVVGVTLKAALFATQVTQATAAVLGPNGLQAITSALVPLAHTFNLFAAVRLAVTVGGKVDDAKVNTQRSIDVIRRWLVNVAGNQQVKLSLAIHQVAFALSGLQQASLPFAADKRDGRLSPSHGPDRHGGLGEVERENAVVVRNAAMAGVVALGLVIQLIAIAHLGKAASMSGSQK